VSNRQEVWAGVSEGVRVLAVTSGDE
jgi:hypothetical protein